MEHEFYRLLTLVTKAFADYLNCILPEIDDDWWQSAVLDVLSSNQQRLIEKKGIDRLSALDLAALLRVFDQNWYKISMKMALSRDERNFVKEMQTVRNRWAHAGADEVPFEDIYRDLDTLQRFAKVIDVDDNLLQEIEKLRNSMLEEYFAASCSSSGDKTPAPEFAEAEVTEFEPGDAVILKSDPSKRGAVMRVLPGKPENRYKVLMNNEKQILYASQIKADVQEDDGFIVLPFHRFHSYLTACQIRHPGLSTLYSLNAARVDFIPYQFRPVMKFIHSDRPRLLIADGVGVGKTIEAGLILRELQARRDVQSVLIICPRPLVTERKWQLEMKRFEENFATLDGKTLRHCISEMDMEGVWPERYQKAIIPYSLFDEALFFGTERKGSRRRQKGLLELDPPPRFDLVIVDEAHHIRNTDTYRYRAVKFFCDHAEAVVFLTATPIQTGNRDLFVLLNLLRPDLVIDQKSFEHMSEPNPSINRAIELARSQPPGWEKLAAKELDEAAATAWGQALLVNNPEFLHVQNQLSRNDLLPEERVQLISELESLHTFAGIINRTRRRDIGNFTVRKPETIEVEFTPSQKKVHDSLLKIQANIFSRIHGNTHVKFMMTTIRRQAASCLYGLIPFLEDILNRHIDELAWDEGSDGDEIPDTKVVEAIEADIRQLLKDAGDLDPEDPKLAALRKIIKDKQQLSNNKIMIFSSFRHTLNYLYQHLKEDGCRIGLVHGGTPDEERVTLRNRFKLSREDKDALDIILFSEVGCEGLDYQFCDCIVNYDLPWNPMRVEQRIGRIDRNGQKSESVAIFNLITPGTVDADIYERCLQRIGVFEMALGGSEEILGEISKEIQDIATNFSLSDTERRDKLQQLSDNKIRLMREQEELEEKQVELFGITLPASQIRKEIDEASSYWLSPEAIQNLVRNYLQDICGEDREFLLGDKVRKTLRLSQEARDRLLEDFKKIPRQNSITYKRWENWLKGTRPHLPITFDVTCASQDSGVEFIMPLHPLVRQAAQSLEYTERAVAAFKVRDQSIPPGDYQFAIYQWRFSGIRQDTVLRPVSNCERLNAKLGRLLERAVDNSDEIDMSTDVADWDKIESQHQKLWEEERQKHRYQTEKHAQYRSESLKTSHSARIALLREQLNQATDKNIKRMRQAQIDAAEADYARRIKTLNSAIEKADIIAKPVAYGVIKVESAGEK